MKCKTIRKIDLMHRRFGIQDGKLCRDCSNLIRHRWNRRTYYKCAVYGDSNSEATDWKMRNVACGMFNVDCGDLEMFRAVRPVRPVRPEKKEIETLDGQIGFDEVEDGNIY